MIDYLWRAPFADREVSRLHAAGFDHEPSVDGWWAQVNRHSLGWVCARDGRELVGFVNVAWDGDVHAFLVDTLVDPRVGRQGIGTELVASATDQARAAGCQWLHVDFDDRLRGFYVDACGFRPTGAGLIALEPDP